MVKLVLVGTGSCKKKHSPVDIGVAEFQGKFIVFLYGVSTRWLCFIFLDYVDAFQGEMGV
jgi:hypothetical protein